MIDVADWRLARVGTRNGPKIQAVRQALGVFAEGIEVLGSDVESGVPEQPIGLAEIARGARQRARAAFDSGPCDVAVGLEDGLAEFADLEDQGALNVGCAVVWDGAREGLGLSSGFAYPPACLGPALSERQPIGPVFDALWNRVRPGETDPTSPSATSVGNIGRLSRGVLTRSEYARHAVLCALVPYLHPDLYPAAPQGGES